IHGVGRNFLAYYATAPTARTTAGWLVVARSSSGSYTYATTAGGMSIRPTLTGEESFEMAGDNDIGSYSTLRVALAGSSTSAGGDLADVSGTSGYEIEYDEWADDASLTNTSGVEWALFDAMVYDDKDGDGTWDRDTDPRLGSACHGSAAVSVRWIEPPTTVDAANDLVNYGAQWGWSVGYASGSSWTSISARASLHLDIKGSCS
ncbi:MAG: hypothetical protein FJ102_23735, partial [Deltaproteobacteria bacterium]|nr:hypothetical protein [Deltaproteobacteria bacterium]